MAKIQCLAAFTSTINMLSYGMSFAWTSPSLPKLMAEDSPIKISNYQESWITVSPFFGALLGGPISAYLANKVGRKSTILATAVPQITAWLIIGFFQYFETICLARVLSGISGGSLFTVVPSYISEISEPKRRGQLAAMLTWMWNLGMLVIYICGPFLSIANMAFISVLVPILFLLCFIWMPESPYFYLLKNREEEATKVLQKFRGQENVDQIIKDIKEELSVTTNVLEIVKTSVNRKILFLVLCLITVQECNGRVPILMNLQKIFKVTTTDNLPAAYVAMIYGAIQMISAFVASFTADKFGRKSLLLFSEIGATTCIIITGTFLFFKCLDYDLESIKYLPDVTLILFIILFSIGLGIVPMIMAGEMFALNVKTYGLCIVDIYTGVLSIFLARFFQFTMNNFGLFVPFWTFAGIGIYGIVFIVTLLPETKGLSLEEIQKNFRGSA